MSYDPSFRHVSLKDLKHTSNMSTFLIMGSDGVWEALENADTGLFVAERLKYRTPFNNTSMSIIAQDLVIEAFVRGSSDNVLGLVIDLTHPDLS